MLVVHCIYIYIKMSYSTKRSMGHPLDIPVVLTTCSLEERARLKEIVDALPMERLKEVLDANTTLSEDDRNMMHNALVQCKAGNKRRM
jgi:hypothetical protein